MAVHTGNESHPEAAVDTSADAALEMMGYKSELPRNLSMVSILGLSFAIMGWFSFGLSVLEGERMGIDADTAKN